MLWVKLIWLPNIIKAARWKHFCYALHNKNGSVTDLMDKQGFTQSCYQHLASLMSEIIYIHQSFFCHWSHMELVGNHDNISYLVLNLALTKLRYYNNVIIAGSYSSTSRLGQRIILTLWLKDYFPDDKLLVMLWKVSGSLMSDESLVAELLKLEPKWWSNSSSDQPNPNLTQIGY